MYTVSLYRRFTVILVFSFLFTLTGSHFLILYTNIPAFFFYILFARTFTASLRRFSSNGQAFSSFHNYPLSLPVHLFFHTMSITGSLRPPSTPIIRRDTCHSTSFANFIQSSPFIILCHLLSSYIGKTNNKLLWKP